MNNCGVHWFWGQTAAGKLLLDLQAATLKSDDKFEKIFAQNNVVPSRIQYTAGKQEI